MMVSHINYDVEPYHKVTEQIGKSMICRGYELKGEGGVVMRKDDYLAEVYSAH